MFSARGIFKRHFFRLDWQLWIRRAFGSRTIPIKFRIARPHFIFALSGGIFSFQQHGVSNDKLQDCSEFPFDRDDQRDLEEGWEPLYEDKSKNLSVFRRKVKNHKLDVYEYRVAGTFYDITPRNYIDAQSDVAYRSEWDSNVLRLEVLQESGDQQLVRWVSKYPYPMYPREYVYVRRTTISPDGRVVMIHCDVVPEEVVPTSSRKNVRVATYSSQSAVRCHKDLDTHGVDYVLTYFDNPEANIPRYIYNWIVNQGGPYFVNQVHTAARELEKSGRTVQSFLSPDKESPAPEEVPEEAPAVKKRPECLCCPIHCPKIEVVHEVLPVVPDDPTEAMLPSKVAENVEAFLTPLSTKETTDKVNEKIAAASEPNLQRDLIANSIKEIFAHIE